MAKKSYSKTMASRVWMQKEKNIILVPLVMLFPLIFEHRLHIFILHWALQVMQLALYTMLVCAHCLVMSDSLWPHGLLPASLLCPCNFPDKNTGEICHFLLQRSSPSRDWTCISCISCIGRQIFYPWATWKKTLYHWDIISPSTSTICFI